MRSAAVPEARRAARGRERFFHGVLVADRRSIAAELDLDAVGACANQASKRVAGHSSRGGRRSTCTPAGALAAADVRAVRAVEAELEIARAALVAAAAGGQVVVEAVRLRERDAVEEGAPETSEVEATRGVALTRRPRCLKSVAPLRSMDHENIGVASMCSTHISLVKSLSGYVAEACA